MVVMGGHQRGHSGRGGFLDITTRAGTKAIGFPQQKFSSTKIALVGTRFGSLDFLLAALLTILHLGGIDIVVNVADGFDALAEASCN